MTGNEIAHTTEESELSVLPPARPPSLPAREMLLSHAQAMQTAFDLAVPLCKTEMVPARFHNKPEDATAAILYGCELGLNPIQSLQHVFSVHGSPAIYSRTMAGLLKARGYRFRTPEKTSEAVEVHGWEPGRDPDTTEPDETARWTIEDATRAGYTTNKKYATEPRAMLYAKALAEVCRHLAPDVLLGISYAVEELEVDTRRAPLLRTGSEPITVAEIMEPATPADMDQLSFDQPESQPEPPLNKAQLIRIENQFHDLGVTESADRHTIISHIVGHPIASTNDLTTSEADTVIKTLRAWYLDKQTPIQDRLREILNEAALAEAESDEV